ncbi:hypothetical protein IHE56_09550 [Streptomyces sp. ID01-12c]|uniref:Secreted protein n=1 Tax=Streptomyces caniscabiei TaxID=2746961 RepID=A0A927QJM3_9ACTN|nr:hypothetical protein [Streptomyces caniscabiei]MBD9702328.1 hypothetical protein [Streptomyces caniscabiei]MBD9728666.1 hypothetical protein [Streptomyces caniscabiei]MDX3514191.1 hypothetical protein [Streptomyces caniscabiei]MDX3723213.1 hypothetical protein [Streptomyces caniscabiei]MDX3730453.1 hypothetical protein [Streptomyces caniscabiei]
MAAMRRGLLHVLAWLLATGAAVTVTWWGVHTVLAGTAYDPPRALPITAADARAQGAPAPDTPTPLPEPSRSAGEQKGGGEDDGRDGDDRDGDGKKPSPTPSAPSKSPTPGPRPGTGAPADQGEVKAYATEGGRVVFSLGESDATLVSATPGPGWSMQVWKTETWIRVDFAAGADRVSVFCTWHDSAPRVDVQNF